MLKITTLICRAVLITLLSTISLSASAHFIVMYTPETALNRASDIPINIVFTHAFAGGPTMAMEKPQRFYYSRRQSGRSEEVDLMEYLEPVDWESGDGTVTAWKANIPRSVMRSLGDYQIILEPTPYYEEGEELYIQQFSKLMINVGGVPGNWAETVGLPAEIEALNKPYANWTGSVFRGIVLSDGLPVAFTEVEVEYLNHPLDVENNRFEDEGIIDAPHPSLASMVILTNEFGEFSFAMPKAGWWGFAALVVGPERVYNNQNLSQDAILWVQVVDFPE